MFYKLPKRFDFLNKKHLLFLLYLHRGEFSVIISQFINRKFLPFLDIFSYIL